MFLRSWRVLTLILAALSMGLTFAHVLELPPKMNYGARLYATVNSTLYWRFGTVGAVIVVSGVLTATVLTFLIRRQRRVLRWTLAGTLFLSAALASWWAIVYPVNAEVRQVWSPHDPPQNRGTPIPLPEPVVQAWPRLHNRWGYGHATGFVFHLAGFTALAGSLVIREDISDDSR